MALSNNQRTVRSQPRMEGAKSLLEVPDINARVDIGFAVQFITERVHPFQKEPIKATRDKARKKIKWAQQKGRLLSDANETFAFGDLMVWAMKTEKWRQGLEGLPILGRASYTGASIKPAVKSYALQLPSTVEECHLQLREWAAKYYALLEDSERQKAELEVLHPLAEIDKRRREKASESGKKGGRPKK